MPTTLQGPIHPRTDPTRVEIELGKGWILEVEQRWFGLQRWLRLRGDQRLWEEWFLDNRFRKDAIQHKPISGHNTRHWFRKGWMGALPPAQTGQRHSHHQDKNDRPKDRSEVPRPKAWNGEVPLTVSPPKLLRP
jgi:hypothetical protein